MCRTLLRRHPRRRPDGREPQQPVPPKSTSNPLPSKYKTMLKLIPIAALAAIPLVVPAQVSVNINVPGIIAVAPPPPRYESVPTPRSGQIWIQGNWYWANNDYAWRSGHWEQARPDYDYAPGRWVRADGGYRWVEGNWKPKGGHGNAHCPPGQAKKGRC